MKEASFWVLEKSGDISCKLCSHYCNLTQQKRGICSVREHRDHKLFSLNYGKICAANLDPIEKKPLYHVLPGSRAFSIASMGCNFSCQFCQNWGIAQYPKGHSGAIVGENATPNDIVSTAKKNCAESIAYTYTEPTVWMEFARDCGMLAKEECIKNLWVSNGFMSKESCKDLTNWVDAANIDLKSFSDKFYREICGGRLEPVLDNLKTLKENGVWVEITTLIIPKKNDSEKELKETARFIAEEIGVETPWHISAFHPDYKMTDTEPTSKKSLEKAYAIGKKAGLENVYIGNLDVGLGKDTLCPACGEPVIIREGYLVIDNRLNAGKCSECGGKIAGIWK